MNNLIKKFFVIVFLVIIVFTTILSLPNFLFQFISFKSSGLTLIVSVAFMLIFVPYMFIKMLILFLDRIRTGLTIRNVANELNLQRVFHFTKRGIIEVRGIIKGYDVSIKLTNIADCEELFLSELIGAIGITPFHLFPFIFTPYTEVKLTSNKNIASPIVIRREDMFDDIIKKISIQDMEIGDQAFDERFLIKCDDEQALKNILNEEMRNEIKKNHQKSIIRIVENKIYYTQKGGIKDKEYLMFIISLLTKIANKIK